MAGIWIKNPVKIPLAPTLPPPPSDLCIRPLPPPFLLLCTLQTIHKIPLAPTLPPPPRIYILGPSPPRSYSYAHYRLFTLHTVDL